MNNLKEIDLKELKKQLINLLHENGIPEFELTLKDFKNNTKGYLGAYKGNSQFTSRIIVKLDVQNHINTLEDLDNFTPTTLKESIMDTLMHEYGHAIEEFVQMDAKRTQASPASLLLKDKFDDMEDFAEGFARLLNRPWMLNESQKEDYKTIVDHYIKKAFTPESVNWVKQEKWKRTLDLFLEKNEKSNAHLATPEGCFNRCKQVSQAIGQRLAEMGENVKILKLEEFKGSFKNAHPKWQEIGNSFATHYVIMLDNKWTVDLTARQFDPNKPKVLILSKEELKNSWEDIGVFHDYNKKLSIKP